MRGFISWASDEGPGVEMGGTLAWTEIPDIQVWKFPGLQGACSARGPVTTLLGASRQGAITFLSEPVLRAFSER